MAEKMPVIQLVAQFAVDAFGQHFQPVAVVAAQRDVQRNNVFHFIVMHRAIAHGCAGHGKTVQHGRLRLRGIAFKIAAFVRIAEKLAQIVARFRLRRRRLLLRLK